MTLSSRNKNQPGPVTFSDPHEVLMDAPIGIFTSTPDGRYISANPALAAMYGYDSPEELIESVTDIAKQLYVDPADREAFIRLMKEQGRVNNYECRLRRKDGSIIWTSRNVREVRDRSGKNIHYQGFVTDITRSKQTGQELSETRWELSTILDSVPVMIWRKDQDSKYVHANRMFCDLVGKKLEDIKGKSDFDIHPQEIAMKYVSDDELVLSSGRPIRNISEKHKKSTGQTGWSLTEKLPCYDKDNNIAGTIGFALDITEIKNTDAALRESEELFRTLIETMAEGIVLKDAWDRYVHWNQTASEIFGIDIGEIKGQTTESFKRQIIREDGSAFHKDDLPSLHTLRTGEPCENVVMGIRRGPQDLVWVKANSRPFFKTGDGKPDGVIISFADITEQKQSEERIRHLNAVLKSMVMVNEVIFNARKVNQLLEDICHALTATRGYHNAWIMLLDEDRRVTDSAQAGVGEAFQGLLSLFQHGKMSSCASRTIESSLIQIVQDPYNECLDCPLAGYYFNRSGLSIRLEVEGRLIGLLAVSVPRELAQDQKEHKLLMNLAGTIAHGVQRIRLEKIRRHQERRLHHYQRIISRINDPMSLVDKDYRYIVVNDAYLQVFNKPRHEIEGHTVEELLGKDVFASQVKPRLDEALSGREVVYEDSFPGLDGTPQYRIMSYYPYHEEDEVSGVVVRALDITERKRAEDTLREKNLLLDNITNTMTDLLSMTDLNGNYKFIGSSHSILGYDLDALMGRNVMEFVHPDDYQRVENALMEFVTNKEDGKKVEYRYRRGDGEYLWFETIGKFILDNAGNPKELLFSTRDITERKQADEKLKRIEWMLSKKPVSSMEVHSETYDQGYGDLTELNPDGIILKSIGHERLKSFADDYLDLLETSSAVYEQNGDYAFGIFASGWCRMMDRASRDLCDTPDNVQALNSGRWLCHESCWTDCSKEAIAGGAPVDIECNGGLRIYAVPILAHGNVMGAINFGYGDPPTDPESLLKLAKTYHLDYGDLLREANAYDSRPPFIIELAKKQLHSTARIIGSMVETKQIGEALRESERRFQKMLGVMPDMISIHSPEMDILYSNWQGFGAVPETMRKINTKCYNTYRGHTDICPDCRAANVLKTKKPMREEIQLPDGTWVDLRVIPLLDKNNHVEIFMEWVRDITERKKAEEVLRESEERLRSYIDNAPDGVFITDENGRYVEVNRAACDITGYTETELLQMHISDILQKTEIEKGIQHFKEVQQNGSARGEIGFVTKSGENRFWHVAAVKLSDTRFLGFVKDITERNKAREEREKLQSQLLQAQKMESVGMLAGGIAHDFNNILHAISGNLEYLGRDKSLDHPDQKRLKTIKRSIDRAADLVQHLLLFSRKAGINKRAMDLNREINESTRIMKRSIPRMIEIELFLDKGAWAINADPIQVEQVLYNLATNAADAMPDGGRLIIETANITLDQNYAQAHAGVKPGRYVLMSVSDTGCGMNKETRKQVFDPFFTTKEPGKGTGLGLSSVFGIVKAHDGLIYCYSEPGKGTTFKIYWPANPEIDVVEDETAAKTASEGGSETILVVDDEEDIRDLTVEALEGHGYQTLSAVSGEQALEIYSDQGQSVDLIILDLNMPGMGGHKCLEEILNINPEARVLIASGYSANGQAKDIQDSGASGFIGKPFQPHKLLAKIREVLDQMDK